MGTTTSASRASAYGQVSLIQVGRDPVGDATELTDFLPMLHLGAGQTNRESARCAHIRSDRICSTTYGHLHPSSRWVFSVESPGYMDHQADTRPIPHFCVVPPSSSCPHSCPSHLPHILRTLACRRLRIVRLCRDESEERRSTQPSRRPRTRSSGPSRGGESSTGGGCSQRSVHSSKRSGALTGY